MTTARVLLTGGGSGGHIYPLLAVAQEIKKFAAENQFALDLRYFGPSDAYAELVTSAGLKTVNIASGKLRRYFSILNIVDVPKFFLGLCQALWKVFWFMPDAVFSKGGTGALPVVLAAWFYRIPVLIHESDAAPGLTNLVSARFARRIAVSFERAAKYFPESKTALTGNPIRKEFATYQTSEDRAKDELGFNPQKPLLLILGGSQGSQRLNEFILTLLKELLEATQVLHQTGAANFAEVKKLSQAALADIPLRTEAVSRYDAKPYLDEHYKTALRAADVIVSRAGSNIFEIAAMGKPAVLIPLAESANDHQRVNAYEYAKTGAAAVIEEPNLLPGIFVNQIKEMLKNPNLLAQMSAAAQKFARPKAAEVIAEEIFRLMA